MMICNLSESRSAMIFWINIGLDFSAAASRFMRSESAAAVTRIDSHRLREQVAALEFGFAVDDLGLRGSFGILDRGFFSRGVSRRVCSICFCFRGSVYCMASDSALACRTRTCAAASACLMSRVFCASPSVRRYSPAFASYPFRNPSARFPVLLAASLRVLWHIREATGYRGASLP